MSAKRQLTLPGLPRTPPGDRMKRAKRDFTRAEFARALERNNIRALGSGLVFADDEIGGWVTSAVCRTNPIRVARRATLAKIIRRRKGRAYD